MANRPVALVTGGAKRIGRAIAEDLCANGYDAAVHFHGSRGEAEALQTAMQALGARVELFEADLSDVSACKAMFAAAAAAFGQIDLLVNNASVFEDDSMGALDEALFDRHFAIHVKAPSFLTEAFAKALPAGAKGNIVNIIDQRVWRPTPNFYSYLLSKAALWTATRTMAQALAPDIRVNAIGPGPTLRNMRQNAEDFQRQMDGLLLRRGPDLSEFGATIRYLVGANSVTGQMIALDGGQHLAWETPDVFGIAE
jgi:NAD(P)-dependent dehydrogenase (short-subunit alcohol dehydrogenase family)